MTETIYQWMNSSHFPVISALLLGILTAISPCPLATNIAAIAYISKNNSNGKKNIIISGLLYTLGLATTYTGIALVIIFGASKFHVAKFFQGNGEKFVGPIMVIVGLIMLNVIKLHFLGKSNFTEKWSDKFKTKGLLGAFLLGALFAMAFCPYSGALYFGALIPLSISNDASFIYPIAYAVGAGTLVLFFTGIIAFSISQLGKYFKVIQKTEKVMRIIAGLLFVLTGLYYIFIYLKVIE
ncbi:MAG: aromatic aminobenezylarsenical efflux permease ArsG family transporter [bacterium]|nr:aromatic aminobenezylarsenical efflux permease ArsG family transporter [bacterium]